VNLMQQKVKNLKEPIMISITRTAETAPNNSTKVTTCRYFDDLSSQWKTDGCFVAAVSATSAKCACYHLTDFGSVMGEPAITAPRLADPIGDASKLLEVSTEHIIAGLIFVGIVLLFLIVTTMLAARYKKAITQELNVAHKYAPESTEAKKKGGGGSSSDTVGVF